MAGNQKNVLLPVHFIKAQSMAASFQSPPIDVRFLDDMQIQLQWTGTAVGTFTVQTSSDYQPGGTPFAAPINPGTWVNLPLSAIVAAAGAPDQAVIDLNEIPSPWIRVDYARTGSTGTVDGYISGKAI